MKERREFLVKEVARFEYLKRKNPDAIWYKALAFRRAELDEIYLQEQEDYKNSLQK